MRAALFYLLCAFGCLKLGDIADRGLERLGTAISTRRARLATKNCIHCQTQPDVPLPCPCAHAPCVHRERRTG